MKTIFYIAPLALALWFMAGCGKSTTTTQNTPTNSNQSSDFSTDTAPAGCDISVPFGGGVGTVGNPYKISTACHFLNIGYLPATWGSRFTVMNDIDFGGMEFTRSIDFTGFLEGNNFRFMNLNLDGLLGLFATSTGTVQNLTLLGVTLNAAGSSRVGLIVGSNYTAGKVINCTATGTISSGVQFIGGLVGLNQGQITHSRASIVVGGKAAVGGVAGFNSGTIQTSSASGLVVAINSGSGASNGGGAGGIAGSNVAGTISNSYSQVIVNGVSEVAGGVGYNTGIVTNSYAAGSITGTGISIGGFIGNNSGGSVTNTYFDYQVAGTSSGSGSAQTTSAMQTVGTYAGWNFSTIWFSPSAGTYPTLR